MNEEIVFCCFKYHGSWSNISQDKWRRHLRINKQPYFSYRFLVPFKPEYGELIVMGNIKASVDWEFKDIRVHGPSLKKWQVNQLRKSKGLLISRLNRFIDSLKES